MSLTQKQFIANYIDRTVPHYNEELFTRSDESIRTASINTILSCQLKKCYTPIQVKQFNTITNYREIRSTLRDYYTMMLSKPSSNAKGPQDNFFQYINLNDSDIWLLRTVYHVAAKDGEEEISWLCAFPKVVRKFYYYLNGGYYNAMYQIVDASTYNNSANGKHSVILKSQFQPIRIFRKFVNIKTSQGEQVMCCTYTTNTFRRMVSVMYFFFAQYGFYRGLQFMGVYGAIFLSDTELINDSYYCFKYKKNKEIYVCVPKEIFDKNQVVQDIVYTLLTLSAFALSIRDMFDENFYPVALGMAFNNVTNPKDKGLSLLHSLEFAYDYTTKMELHLPEDQKNDSYCVLRWMVHEYNNLRIKDNLNVLTKKLNCSNYIASILGAKLSRNIYRLKDNGKNADLAKIRQALMINPMFLLNAISKDRLVNFRGIVTDMDSLLATKFTYKGESGIKTISNKYKLIHPSNLGVLDPDASSPSDPGVSGSIVPMVNLYNKSYFSEFQEPLTWDADYQTLVESYASNCKMQEVFDIQHKLKCDREEAARIIAKEEQEQRYFYDQLMAGKELQTQLQGIPLEGSGLIQYLSYDNSADFCEGAMIP